MKIFNNNIKPTDINFFAKFKNLKCLKIGIESTSLENNENRFRNEFYGSFKSWEGLSNLGDVDIEATDVNEGLEYLPKSLAESINNKRIDEGENYNKIECSPHSTNAKCKTIQDQLKTFDYDLEAWQLAHPEKMLIARPELFANPDSKEKWKKNLTNKIIKAKQELQDFKVDENDDLDIQKKGRLESKLKILRESLQKLENEKK